MASMESGDIHLRNFKGWLILPLFLFLMALLGFMSFTSAYSSDKAHLVILYAQGGFVALIFLVFYLAIFGPGKVAWMFINAGLGLFGIIAQIDGILLHHFGKRVGDYPLAVHVVPFAFYVLYTFLIYQSVLYFGGAYRYPKRRRPLEAAYIIGSLLIYTYIYWATHAVG